MMKNQTSAALTKRWTEWQGGSIDDSSCDGPSTVGERSSLEVKLRSGMTLLGYKATFRWDQSDHAADVVAWRSIDDYEVPSALEQSKTIEFAILTDANNTRVSIFKGTDGLWYFADIENTFVKTNPNHPETPTKTGLTAPSDLGAFGHFLNDFVKTIGACPDATETTLGLLAGLIIQFDDSVKRLQESK